MALLFLLLPLFNMWTEGGVHNSLSLPLAVALLLCLRWFSFRHNDDICSLNQLSIAC